MSAELSSVIKKVSIKNFKSIRSCEIELDRFQVLVGANSSGKSSFLEALETLGKLLSSTSCELKIPQIRWRGCEPGTSVSWTTHFVNGLYRLDIADDAASDSGLLGMFKVRHEELQMPNVNFQREEDFVTYDTVEGSGSQSCFSAALRDIGQRDSVIRKPMEYLCGMRIFQLDPQALASEGPVAHHDKPMLSKSGMGLVTLLDYLLGAERSLFSKIESSLRDYVPGFEELIIKPGSQQGDRALAFRDKQGWTFDAAEVSSGMLLFLGYLTLVYAQETTVLMIEEPENGIHPKRISEVIELTRALAEKEDVQVIISSHSPYLLDCVKPEEVLFFSRDPKTGETKISPMTELPGAKKRLEDYFTGELLFNFSEEDLKN